MSGVNINRGTVAARMAVWDVGSLSWVPWDGALNAESITIGTVTDGGSGKTLQTAIVNLSATGTVVTAVGGRRIKVYSFRLMTNAAASVNWRSGGATALDGAMPFTANAGITESVAPPNYLMATAVGQSLDLVVTGAATVTGVVRYWADDTA